MHHITFVFARTVSVCLGFQIGLSLLNYILDSIGACGFWWFGDCMQCVQVNFGSIWLQNFQTVLLFEPDVLNRLIGFAKKVFGFL